MTYLESRKDFMERDDKRSQKQSGHTSPSENFITFAKLHSARCKLSLRTQNWNRRHHRSDKLVTAQTKENY